MLRDWYAHMARQGITEEEAEAHFAQWAEEDFYVALVDELGLIRAAGFPRPDCFWRDGGISVYGGFES
jgi:sugar (pentulose or hexulose) kinase